MTKLYTVMALAGLVSLGSQSGAIAQEAGDAVRGMEVFQKRCLTCHIVGDAAEVSKRKAGPNLTDVYGRQAGSRELFPKKYGKSLVAAGEAGLVWNTEELTAYVENPRKYLRAKLDDKKARSKMSFKLSGKKRAQERADIVAYLRSLNPPKDGDAATTEAPKAEDS
ncbi:MAG: c-type cytochrome [Pseudomonadota bacterium]